MMNIILFVVLILAVAGLAYWAIGRVGGAWGLPDAVVITVQVVIVILLVAFALDRTGWMAGVVR